MRRKSTHVLRRALPAVLLCLLLLLTMPPVAAFDFDAPELRLADLPEDFISMVDVTVYTQAEANLLMGLDVIRDKFVPHTNAWYFRIIVPYYDRAIFAQHNLAYTIVQDCIIVRFDWWDEEQAPAPEGVERFALPGIPGHPNTTGRPDLTVDASAVFDPTGVTTHARFGFPMRTGYRTVTEYYAEMNFLAQAFPEIVQLHVMGYSHEGNPMVVLEISSDPGVEDGRPNHVHNGGAHAREWSASEYTMNLAWYLLTQYGHCPRITELLDTTRVWLLPVTNPDGMHYDQRFNPGVQRKNRRNNSDFPGFNPNTRLHWGVDLNRNFPFDFVLGETNISADTFRGPAPGSEPEIQALMELYLNNMIVSDISGHTFGHFNIFQNGDHINNQHIWTVATELFRMSSMNPQPSGAANANGQSVGWMFGTANTLSMLTEYGHHGFVRPYMGEPTLSRFGAITPYNDQHGRPRRIPLAYRWTNVPGNSGAPTSDIVAEVAFLDTSLYNGLPLTFEAMVPHAVGMQATVARVNEAGEAGKLEGKILLTIQGANINTNRDVVLAAQYHGAVAVIFVGGNAGATGWQTTDFYVGSANTQTTGGGNAVTFNIDLVGTTVAAQDITIPVASTYRMAAREFHEWVQGGGDRTLRLTSTPADDPANAHLYPVIPNSQLCLWYRYVPAFLHMIEAADRFSAWITGEILCEDGFLQPGASLELYIDNPNRIRQGLTFNAAGAMSTFQFMPEDTFVQRRTSRLDSEDGTFRWSVTPSVQRDFDNAGYTITAMPPAYSGLYAAVVTGIHIDEYKEIVEQDLVLDRGIRVDYAAKTLAGNYMTIYFSTANADYTLADLTVTLNGEDVTATVTDFGTGAFRIVFSVIEFGRDFDMVITVNDDDVILASYRVTPISIRITNAPAVLRRNTSIALDASVVPAAAPQELIWSSSNPAAATVSADGVVTARVATGVVVITARTPDGQVVTSMTIRLSM